jgi:plastocyanin
MRRLTWILALLLAAGALAAFGCGGDDDEAASEATPTQEATEAPTEEPTEEATEAPTEEAGGGGETLALSSPEDGSLVFEPTELSAPAGSVTIQYDNPSTTPHAVEVEGNGVEEETETITQGNAELTVDLEPGEYVFYCPVGNHRQEGMEGTLTVE